MYLSKSTSNSEKSYSSRSKSTQNKIVLEVQVKSKQLYLKYTQKYFYRPKNIILAKLKYVTISQAFLLVKVLHINKRGVFIGWIATKHHDIQTTSAENNSTKKQITKYQ